MKRQQPTAGAKALRPTRLWAAECEKRELSWLHHCSAHCRDGSEGEGRQRERASERAGRQAGERRFPASRKAGSDGSSSPGKQTAPAAQRLASCRSEFLPQGGKKKASVPSLLSIQEGFERNPGDRPHPSSRASRETFAKAFRKRIGSILWRETPSLTHARTHLGEYKPWLARR